MSAARTVRHAPLELRGPPGAPAPAHRARLRRVARGAHPVCRLAPAVGAAPKGAPVPSEDRPSFAARCGIRERERHLGTGYGFGVFVGERFAGEVTLSSIQRGPVPERVHRLLDRRVPGRARTLCPRRWW